MSGMSCVALMTTQMWPIWPSRDSRFDMPALDRRATGSTHRVTEAATVSNQ
jgi:hypothetical protein